MTVRITLNHAGMAALLNSSEVRNALTPFAENVLAAAEADPHDDSGDYEASLHIESATTDRAVERVVADVPYAMVVEANFGVLARALDSA